MKDFDAKRKPHERGKPLSGTKEGRDPETPDAPKAGDASADVLLKPIPIKRIVVPIVGTDELIVHAWGPKGIKMMQQAQAEEVAPGARKKKKHPPRDPHADYLDAFYTLGQDQPLTTGCRYGVPAVALSRAMQTAALDIEGITKAAVMRAVRVKAHEGNLLELWSHSGPYMRTDSVRLGGIKNPADLRYRPAFRRWKIRVPIQFNSAVLSETRVVNLLHIAGFAVGLCEWRPEKGGEFGTWELDEKPDEQVEPDPEATPLVKVA